MRSRILSSACAAACLVLSAPGAFGQTDRNAAVALYDEAEKLMAAQKYAEACPKYAESHRLDPQLGALMHLADCYEKNGQLASAWSSFRDAMEIAERRQDKRVQVARERAAALEAKLPRLTIVVPAESRAPGLEVRRDGIVVGAATWGSAVPVDPGEHNVEASAPGKIAWSGKATTIQGKTESISIPALADAQIQTTAPTTSESPAPAALPDKPRAGSTQRLLGWTAVGAGAVGLGVGVVFMLKRGSKLDERDAICPAGAPCPNREQRQAEVNDLTGEARTASTIGSIGLLAGSALVAGGLVLVFTAPRETVEVAITPAVLPGFQGLTLQSSIW